MRVARVGSPAVRRLVRSAPARAEPAAPTLNHAGPSGDCTSAGHRRAHHHKRRRPGSDGG